MEIPAIHVHHRPTRTPQARPPKPIEKPFAVTMPPTIWRPPWSTSSPRRRERLLQYRGQHSCRHSCSMTRRRIAPNRRQSPQSPTQLTRSQECQPPPWLPDSVSTTAPANSRRGSCDANDGNTIVCARRFLTIRPIQEKMPPLTSQSWRAIQVLLAAPATSINPLESLPFTGSWT